LGFYSLGIKEFTMQDITSSNFNLNTLIDKLINLQLQLDKTNQELNQTKQLTGNMEKKIDKNKLEYEKEINDLKQELQQHKQKYEENKQKDKLEHEKEINDLKQELQQHKQKYEENILKHEKDKQKYDTDINDLKQKLHQNTLKYDTDINNLKQELQQEKQKYEKDRSEYEQRIKELKEENKTIRNSLLTEKDMNYQLNSANENLTLQNHNISNTVDENNLEIQRLRTLIKHPLWEKYGKDLENKLLHRLSDEKKLLIDENLVNKFKQATTDEEFLAAMQTLEDQLIENPGVKKNTGIGKLFGCNSETTNKAKYFKKKVDEECPDGRNFWTYN
jgi:chromosome segregation ATPase